MEETQVLFRILFNENGFVDPLDLSLTLLNEETYNSSIGPLVIYVYGNEGSVPHFHIVNPKNKDEIACIGIFEAKYFNHQADTTAKSLDKKVLKALDKTLRQTYKNSPDTNYTNWNHIKDVWIQQNGISRGYANKVVDVQPDYSKTSGEIKEK